MSRIDEELEQAVREAEAAKPEGKSTGSAQARSLDEVRPVVAEAEPQAKMRWGLLGALLVLMGGILTIVFTGSQDAVVYSYKVDEVKAKGADLGERQLRVQGGLVAGTLVRRDNPCEYRFMIRNLDENGKLAKTGEPLEVRYPMCVVPDTFRDKEAIEVTAEGRLAADGHLQASKIFAKCPSKYDPNTHEMNDNSKVGGEQPRRDVIPASAAVR